MADETIRDIISRHTNELLAIPSVIGVAEGRDKGTPCILLFVTNKKPELLKQLPESLGGYLIKIEESDQFQALKN
ncbi:hypothetical protein ACFLXJ_02745 [Chloroflexota bacterium]